jgi:hypothetical protein
MMGIIIQMLLSIPIIVIMQQYIKVKIKIVYP